MTTQQEISALHKWHHDDYNEAKQQIHLMIGSLNDIEVFGRQVLVAMYVRPPQKANGLYMTSKQQEEDIYQGKAGLVLKVGPGAFQGDQSYISGTFGTRGAPVLEDWVFIRASSGFPLNLIGEGAQRIKVASFGGREIDMFDWDGWPCRIVDDEAFIGRINKPHHIV